MAMESGKNEKHSVPCICNECIREMGKEDVEKAISEFIDQQEEILGNLVENQLTLYALYEREEELTKKKVK